MPGSDKIRGNYGLNGNQLKSIALTFRGNRRGKILRFQLSFHPIKQICQPSLQPEAYRIIRQ